MSVRTPVIATKVGAVTEVLDDKSGTLISPLNESQMYSSLIKFSDKRLTFVKKSKFAYEKVFRKFNNDLMANKYMRLINS